MRIGIDFDNTIVSYDAVFHKVALERSLVPPALLPSKLAVREHLRSAGQEDLWTELQGYVYGTRMADVEAYGGVLDFLRWARAHGIQVCIISHKTRHPFIGPAYDLHAAARSWIEAQCIRPGLVDPGQVFLELTKAEKIGRIRSTACDYYIDDLPEILLAEEFPRETAGILFDPDRHHGDSPAYTRLSSWQAILKHFQLSGEIARLLDIPAALRLEPRGGGNNRVYVLSTKQGRRYVVKEYFRDPSDPRDRLGAEQAFLRYAAALGIQCVPKVAASSNESGLGIYEYIDGRPVSEVSAAYVQQA
ncbi:MAG TPA: phosphotransferase, partial [Steroidobacteraceae bacterium]|nr:phosphotransferase [Steroidobacteraceae bacterium]